MGNRGKSGTGMLLNFLLVIIIVALYVVTSRPDMLGIQTSGSPVFRGEREDVISLQWIIDYEAKSIDGIIDALGQSGVRSTFIVSGQWAQNNSDTLLKISAQGHEIGISGNNSLEDGNLDWVTGDLIEALEIVESLTGKQVKLYYSGARNRTVSSRAAKDLGLTHIAGTVDMLCAKGTAEDIVARAEQVTQGSILIMQPTVQACDAIAGLVEYFQNKGINISLTGEIINTQ